MTKSKGIMPPRRFWTGAELTVLRERYPHEPTERIAADLGRPLPAVYRKAHGLGLKKTPEYLATEHAHRLRRGDNVGKAHRFQPGQTPWNAGTHYQAGGRAAETQFQPGRLPHNTQPVGSHKLDKDGNLLRKVREIRGNNSRRWRAVHELVWVEANGPVPPRHIVVFKPGMRTNVLEEITLDRVECLSLAENMKRNTRHNLPKELNAVIQLRAVLTRQINQRSKHEQENH